jgi:hypothetical protein
MLVWLHLTWPLALTWPLPVLTWVVLKQTWLPQVTKWPLNQLNLVPNQQPLPWAAPSDNENI